MSICGGLGACVQSECVYVLILKRKPDIAEMENAKVTRVCGQNSLVVKGNKSKVGIGLSFLQSQGRCKEGPVELQVVRIKYFF